MGNTSREHKRLFFSLGIGSEVGKEGGGKGGRSGPWDGWTNLDGGQLVESG